MQVRWCEACREAFAPVDVERDGKCPHGHPTVPRDVYDLIRELAR